MAYSHAETNAIVLSLFEEGAAAYDAGKTLDDNPYDAADYDPSQGKTIAHHALWEQGWKRGRRKASLKTP